MTGGGHVAIVEHHICDIWPPASWGHEMASSYSPACVAHTARPTANAGTRTLVGPAGSLGARLGAFAWRMEPLHRGGSRLGTGSCRRVRAPHLDLVLLWVGAWYQLPFIDRYVRAWMWRHGAWEVRPPEIELGHSGGTD